MDSKPEFTGDSVQERFKQLLKEGNLMETIDPDVFTVGATYPVGNSFPNIKATVSFNFKELGTDAYEDKIQKAAEAAAKVWSRLADEASHLDSPKPVSKPVQPVSGGSAVQMPSSTPPDQSEASDPGFCSVCGKQKERRNWTLENGKKRDGFFCPGTDRKIPENQRCQGKPKWLVYDK